MFEIRVVLKASGKHTMDKLISRKVSDEVVLIGLIGYLATNKVLEELRVLKAIHQQVCGEVYELSRSQHLEGLFFGFFVNFLF